jgi:hypothetical protein
LICEWILFLEMQTNCKTQWVWKEKISWVLLIANFRNFQSWKCEN